MPVTHAGGWHAASEVARNDERLAKLEVEVSALRAELDELKKRLGE